MKIIIQEDDKQPENPLWGCLVLAAYTFGLVVLTVVMLLTYRGV